MHTFNGKHGTTIHYNSDLSGEVIITRKSGHGKDFRGNPLPEITFDDDIRVDGRDLITFVADYVRLQRITELEQMSDEAILGIEERDEERDEEGD